VNIDIAPLKPAAWKLIKTRCTGGIASILDLLQGRLSEGVMSVVTDREKGLFPKPGEIAMRCSCPDWATMCKHVAAVLYGVGARLDESPELLFLLRDVNHEELIGTKAEAAVEAVLRGGTRRRLDADLEEVFGVEMEGAPARLPSASKARITSRAKANERATHPAFPAAITGHHIGSMRKRLGLSQKELAALLGVSAGAVSIWERRVSPLHLQMRTRSALEREWKRSWG
jgi:uncharacterized Zn finger protein